MDSNFWDKNKSLIRSDILVNPELLKMIGNVKGKTILDLGCGDGNLTSSLHKKGAEIIGIDKNEHSIKLAKEKEGEYFCKDIRKVDFEKNKFDIIYSSMVFLFLSDKEIKDLAKKIYFWLKKGGMFVFSDKHASTEIQNDNSLWVNHEIPDKFNYFKTSKIRATLKNEHGENVSFGYYHRSLQNYIQIFTLKGFKLIDLSEPQATQKQANKFQLGFENNNPSYIIFKFIKD